MDVEPLKAAALKTELDDERLQELFDESVKRNWDNVVSSPINHAHLRNTLSIFNQGIQARVPERNVEEQIRFLAGNTGVIAAFLHKLLLLCSDEDSAKADKLVDVLDDEIISYDSFWKTLEAFNNTGLGIKYNIDQIQTALVEEYQTYEKKLSPTVKQALSGLLEARA